VHEQPAAVGQVGGDRTPRVHTSARAVHVGETHGYPKDAVMKSSNRE
jgi:hypothetical protein